MTQDSKKRTIATTGADRNDRWLVLGVSLFIAAITWVVFGQTLHHQFINFDDREYIYQNPEVSRGLSLEGLVWAFTQRHAANWHPITWISHMLDCQFYGLNPGGHHFTNVILHAATAIALFFVLRQMTGAIWRSAFVAAVFAVHPLRVESVAWVAERKDVLSGLFFMLTIAAYVRYVRATWSASRYGLALLFFAIGLMCKPMLVTLPLVLLFLDFWPLNRLNASTARRLTVEKLPLVALALASCIVTLFAQRGAMQPLVGIGVPARLANAIISYVDYLRQMFWPAKLTVLYPWEASRLGTANVALSVAALVVISVTILISHRRRYLITGWLWYLVMLVPVIGILQVGAQVRADRYTYLPQIGVYLMLTWLVADLCARWTYRHLFLGSLSSIILVSLIFSARAQTLHWRDSLSLWSHALSCTADNTIAEGNVGEAYYANGNTREALLHFQKALRIEPNQPFVHSSLGVFYLEMGQLDNSVAHLKRALEIEPHLADAHYNLGNTYLQMGRAPEAAAEYGKALETDPNDVEALNNLAWVLATSSDLSARDGSRAIKVAERADSLTQSKQAVLGATLAAAYAEAGKFAEAIQTGQRALHLASAEGNLARVDSIRAQIEVYQTGAPFRDNRFSSPPP